MLALPETLVGAARSAGIKVPEDLQNYDKNEFPHWVVFCKIQLGASMPFPGVHFGNAEVIAAVSEEDIRTITCQQLIEQGFQSGRKYPNTD